MAEDALKVFISYSWDSKEHKDRVYHLAQALRDDGIDCTIDQFVQSPDNRDRWMLDQIDESAFVLIVCTERYYQRYRGKEEVNKGLGVTWKSTLIMGKLHDSQGRNTKFYPIFFDPPDISIIPDGIRTSYFDLSGYDLFKLDNNEQRLKEDGGYQDLYRLLMKQPYVMPRKIGSLKKLETVDRENEQQEAEAAAQQRLLEQQRQEAEQYIEQ
ncbi:toll/interleukin-1 receptor domain-containing protein [Leptodesmis sp.]|uniref:toll/interleukin-1 receptor domain-containing protein n=1 Tax=Leptodesmis sp. TaxID=3100501 RepID=UPI004053478D